MNKKVQHNQKPKQQQQAEKCPRCDSHNTKFCYYNNYTKSQPRSLCKSCKRHWTHGGTLRNVPVGGARKNKRLKTSTAAAEAAKPHSTNGEALFPAAAPVSASSLPLILPDRSAPAGLQFPFSDSSSSSFDSLQSSSFYDSSGEAIAEEYPWRMEASCSCNWEDIDALVSTAELDIPWDDDDYEIKIKP